MIEVYLSDVEIPLGIVTIPTLYDDNHELHENVKVAIIGKATKEDYIKQALERGKDMSKIEWSFKHCGDKYFYFVSVD